MIAENIIVEKFKSLEGMLDIMEKRPLNRAFKDEDYISSQKIDEKNWSGCQTYADAMQVIKEGYKEPLEKMKKEILKIGEMQQQQRPRMRTDVIGFVPNVPNTLMNLPQTMINKQKTPMKSKTIHLIYSFCAHSRITTDQLIKGGTNFIGLVNSLEKQGYRVKIDVMFSTTTEKTCANVLINVKEYGQNLNLLKLAFPLVHPSMLRRVSFKWLETMPEIKDKRYNGSYGTPTGAYVENDIKKEIDYYKQKGIITSNDSYYCNVYKAFKANDIKELALEMGLK